MSNMVTTGEMSSTLDFKLTGQFNVTTGDTKSNYRQTTVDISSYKSDTQNDITEEIIKLKDMTHLLDPQTVVNEAEPVGNVAANSELEIKPLNISLPSSLKPLPSILPLNIDKKDIEDHTQDIQGLPLPEVQTNSSSPHLSHPQKEIFHKTTANNQTTTSSINPLSSSSKHSNVPPIPVPLRSTQNEADSNPKGKINNLDLPQPDSEITPSTTVSQAHSNDSTTITETTTRSTTPKSSTKHSTPPSVIPSNPPTKPVQPVPSTEKHDKNITTSTTPTVFLETSTEIQTHSLVQLSSADPQHYDVQTGVSDNDFNTTESITTAGVVVPIDHFSGAKIATIVVPIVLGILALVIVGVVFLVYRRRRRHRKANIIRYKRYSQNGEASVPLTSVINDNFRHTTVSAHEDAIVYSLGETTLRPPRPIYRNKLDKTEDMIPLRLSMNTNNYDTPDPGDDTDTFTTLVDNTNYEKSPVISNGPPKVPIRKSSCDSHGSLKKTPGSSKREISWPVDRPPGVSPHNSSPDSFDRSGQRESSTPPMLPPSPQRRSRSSRPMPPSPRSLPSSPSSSRPVPPTPPSAHSIPLTPSLSRPIPPTPPSPHSEPEDHGYDPVYVPSSDANAINRRLDDAGYVTSRRMRMHGLNQQPYEEVNLISDSINRSIPSPVISSSPGSARSHTGGATGTSSPGSVRTHDKSKTESEYTDIGDQSFDTLGTENSNLKVTFSLEDITKVIDSSFGPQSTDSSRTVPECMECEYSTVPSDSDNERSQSSMTDNVDNVLPCDSDDDDDDDKDGIYETVDF